MKLSIRTHLATSMCFIGSLIGACSDSETGDPSLSSVLAGADGGASEQPGMSGGALRIIVNGNGITSGTVNFVVRRSHQVVRMGSLQLTGGTALATINDSQPGGNYAVSVTLQGGSCGATVDGANVRPRRTTSVTLTLSCAQDGGLDGGVGSGIDAGAIDSGVDTGVADAAVDAGTGSIDVGGSLNFCPRIGLATGPATLAVGQSANVSVTAQDANTDTLAYSWSLVGTHVGTLANASSATASFTCTAAGTQSLTVSVSDAPSLGENACTSMLQSPLTLTCTQ